MLLLNKKSCGGPILESIDIARRVVEIAGDKQASDIVLLDTRTACNFADYFVICSGESERQIDAIEEEIEKVFKKEGIPHPNREGNADSGWILLDFGDIIVHIFSPVEREFYNLDELWGQAQTVVRIQ